MSQGGVCAGAVPKQAASLWPAALIAAAVAYVYGQGVFFDFINLDDPDYFLNRPELHSGLTFSGLAWAFTESVRVTGFYFPLTWTAIMAGISLFGLDPGWFHYVSLCLHAVASILVYRLAGLALGRVWPAFCVGLVFAMHPTRVESVLWAVELKDLLCAVFSLSALLAHCRFGDLGRGKWLSLILFGCALASKPAAVVVPVFMVLLDYWPLGRIGAGGGLMASLWRKGPHILLALGWSWFTLWGVRSFGALSTTAELSPLTRFAHAPIAYWAYLRQTFLPDDGSMFRPHPGPPETALALLALAGLGALLGAVVWMRRSRPQTVVGFLWFLVGLFPVIGVAQSGGQSWADRFLYLPQIGIWLAKAPLVSSAASVPAARRAERLFCLAALALAGFYTFRTLDYAPKWRDSITLYEHSMRVGGESSLLLNNIGVLYFRSGRETEALDAFLKAESLGGPTLANSRNLAACLWSLGRTAEARDAYLRVLRLAPCDGQALFMASEAASILDRKGEAQGLLLRALACKETDHQAMFGLGRLAYTAGLPDKAKEWYEKSKSVAPLDGRPWFGLGLVHRDRGDYADALAAFEKAGTLRVNPQEALFEAAKAAQRLGDREKATNYGLKAFASAPADARIREFIETLRSSDPAR